MHKANSPAFSKKVLVPLWSFQLLCTIGNLGIYLWTAYAIVNHAWEIDLVYLGRSRESRKSFLFISTVILILTNLCVLALVIFQISRFHNNRLAAKTMLNHQIGLTVYAFLAWVVEMLGFFGVLVGGFKTVLDFAFTTSAFGFFLGTLIYSAVIYDGANRAKRETLSAYEKHVLPSYDDLAPIRKLDSLAKGPVRCSEDSV